MFWDLCNVYDPITLYLVKLPFMCEIRIKSFIVLWCLKNISLVNLSCGNYSVQLGGIWLYEVVLKIKSSSDGCLPFFLNKWTRILSELVIFATKKAHFPGSLEVRYAMRLHSGQGEWMEVKSFRTIIWRRASSAGRGSLLSFAHFSLPGIQWDYLNGQ